MNERRAIPPNSVAKVKCKLTQSLDDFTLQADPNSRYLIPRTVHSGGEDAVLCVMNVTGNFIVMKKGNPVGLATEFDSKIEVEEQEDEVESLVGTLQEQIRVREVDDKTGSLSDQTCIKVQKGVDSPCGNISKEVNGKTDSYCGSSQADMKVRDGNDSPCGIIPAHIQSMIEVSKGHLTEDQIHELTACLKEELSQYTMILEYRKGKHHLNADALSRINKEKLCDFFQSRSCVTGPSVWRLQVLYESQSTMVGFLPGCRRCG